MGLSWSEIDLTSLAHKQAEDASLLRLAEMADKGLAIGITFLVDGVWFSGDLVPSESWAEHLDESIDKGLREAGERQQSSAEGLEELRKVLRGASFKATVEDDRQRKTEVEEELERETSGKDDWDVRDLPDRLARDLIGDTSTPPALTLKDVVVTMPGSDEFTLPLARVKTRHIGAWYIGRRAFPS